LQGEVQGEKQKQKTLLSLKKSRKQQQQQQQLKEYKYICIYFDAVWNNTPPVLALSKSFGRMPTKVLLLLWQVLPIGHDSLSELLAPKSEHM
jgi:hypothetical protein